MILILIIAAERQRGSSLILTFQFRMRSVSFAPVFSPELYIVEISICVCGDVRFSGERFFVFDEYGGAGYKKFRQIVCACISFSMCSSGDVSKTKLGENSSSKYEGKYEFVCVCKHASRRRMF